MPLESRILIVTLVVLLFTLCSLTMALKVVVSKAGTACANGVYLQQSPSSIPSGFAKVCRKSRWDTNSMWAQLTNGKTPWYLKDDEAYIYYNVGDNKWWIDAPEGHGLYVSFAPDPDDPSPPTAGWVDLAGGELPLPEVSSGSDEL